MVFKYGEHIVDKTSIVGWASFGLALFFFYRLLQGLVGYDHKTREFTLMTAIGHWGAMALIFGVLIYAGS